MYIPTIHKEVQKYLIEIPLVYLLLFFYPCENSTKVANDGSITVP